MEHMLRYSNDLSRPAKNFIVSRAGKVEIWVGSETFKKNHFPKLELAFFLNFIFELETNKMAQRKKKYVQ